jgi:NADH-quinone oxidoreductase subunit C
VSKLALERLSARLGSALLETHAQFGDDTAVVEPARWKEAALVLRDDPRCAMDMFVDLTAVDWLGRRTGPRFDVVVHLRSLDKLHRVRLKARIDEAPGAPPRIDSLCDVWAGANWFERECFDMFGIEFVGHPDLRRILMYDEFVGHPLRKDYAASHIQPLVPFREGVPDKLPPFGPDEGMPFGRQTHAAALGAGAAGGTARPSGRSLLGDLDPNEG